MKRFLFLAAFAAAALVSCSKAEVETSYLPGDKAVQFRTNLNYYTVKAAIEENVLSDVKVIAGAPINQTVTGAPDAGTMTVSPTLYWGAGQTAPTKFIAITGGQTSPVVDAYNVLSGEYNYAYCAKLMSAVATTEVGETVDLEFHHIFSKLVINITNNLGADQVSTVNVSNIASVGTINFETREVTITGPYTTNANAYEETENSKYVFALLPQTATPVITITTGLGATYTFTASDAFSFQGAKVATINITLNSTTSSGSGLTSVGAMNIEVADWVADETVMEGTGSTNLSDNYWYIEGTINDTSWDTAFPMQMTAANVWEADFTYQATGLSGEGFKLHKTTGWGSSQAGYDPANAIVAADGETWYYVWPNKNDNGNIKLGASGSYHIVCDFTKGSDGQFMISINS